jgi:hypothetical protein
MASIHYVAMCSTHDIHRGNRVSDTENPYTHIICRWISPTQGALLRTQLVYPEIYCSTFQVKERFQGMFGIMARTPSNSA